MYCKCFFFVCVQTWGGLSYSVSLIRGTPLKYSETNKRNLTQQVKNPNRQEAGHLAIYKA